METLSIGRVGTFDVELPVLTIGSGSPRGVILAVQHGGERSPLWVVKEFLASSGAIRGTATVIPVVNPFGFVAGERNEVIDGKDLNRQYPGDPNGDFSTRIAAAIFSRCRAADFVIDLHTFSRQTPMIAGLTRSNGRSAPAVERVVCALQPDAVWVIDRRIPEDRRFAGALDDALADVDVPCVFVEMPNVGSIVPTMIARIAAALENVFATFGTAAKLPAMPPQFTARYQYADVAGLFEPRARPLQTVAAGDVMGTTFTLPNFEAVDVTAHVGGTILTILDRDVVRTGSKLASIGVPVK